MAAPSIPSTHRAYVYENYGDSLQEIKLRTNVPQAPLGPTQVRIQIHSTALNPIDYKLVELGHLFLPTPPTKENPHPLGFDLAGTLVEVGADVKREDLKVGDAVYAMAFFGGTGSFADYFVLDAKYVAPKPKNVSFNDAAGLPLAGETSYQALVTYGKLKKGDRVLILGGSSGTGTLAIQIAKALGAAHVIATTSTRNIELVKSLGADEVVDYTKEKWGDVLEPHSIDLIYDCGFEGASWNDAAQKVLKKDTGIFVTIDPYVKANETTIGATFHAIMTDSNATDLKTLTGLVEAGKLKIPIDSVHSFENLLDAVKVQKSGRARGKIIVQVLPETTN
ncbi:hypothetical protein Gpo141_00012906 [Globisporangium polare]